MKIRIMRNTSRIGKPFKVVMGKYIIQNLSQKEKWVTEVELGQFDTRHQATHYAIAFAGNTKREG